MTTRANKKIIYKALCIVPKQKYYVVPDAQIQMNGTLLYFALLSPPTVCAMFQTMEHCCISLFCHPQPYVQCSKQWNTVVFRSSVTPNRMCNVPNNGTLLYFALLSPPTVCAMFQTMCRSMLIFAEPNCISNQLCLTLLINSGDTNYYPGG